jgi:hypothetical protein
MYHSPNVKLTTVLAGAFLLVAGAARGDLEGVGVSHGGDSGPQPTVDIRTGLETPVFAAQSNGSDHVGVPINGSLEYRDSDVKVQGLWHRIKSALFGDEAQEP